MQIHKKKGEVGANEMVWKHVIQLDDSNNNNGYYQEGEPVTKKAKMDDQNQNPSPKLIPKETPLSQMTSHSFGSDSSSSLASPVLSNNNEATFHATTPTPLSPAVGSGSKWIGYMMEHVVVGEDGVERPVPVFFRMVTDGVNSFFQPELVPQTQVLPVPTPISQSDINPKPLDWGTGINPPQPLWFPPTPTPINDVEYGSPFTPSSLSSQDAVGEPPSTQYFSSERPKSQTQQLSDQLDQPQDLRS